MRIQQHVAIRGLEDDSFMDFVLFHVIVLLVASL